MYHITATLAQTPLAGYEQKPPSQSPSLSQEQSPFVPCCFHSERPLAVVPRYAARERSIGISPTYNDGLCDNLLAPGAAAGGILTSMPSDPGVPEGPAGPGWPWGPAGPLWKEKQIQTGMFENVNGTTRGCVS